MHRRQLRADIVAFGLNGGEDDILRKQIFDRKCMLRQRIGALYDIEEHFLPEVANLRKHSTYDTRSTFPEQLRLLLPSVIVCSSMVPDISLQSEWRLREGQAYDALADLRGHLEVLEYLYSRDRSSADRSAYALRLGVAISTFEAEKRAVICRYREAYSALRTLAQILHKTEWEETLMVLHDDDIVYVTDRDISGKPSWIWNLGGTALLPTDDLLEVHLNKSLSQGETFSPPYTYLSNETSQLCELHGASLALGC